MTLDWIFHASEGSAAVEAAVQTIVSRGQPGRLFRLITPGNDLPQFLWQREFSDAGALDGDPVRYTAENIGAERVEASAWSIEDAR